MSVYFTNRFSSICFALIASCLPALAQSGAPIKQSGQATPGHALYFVTNGIAGDAGTAVNGFLTSLGVTASGDAICQNSAGPTSAGWQRICLGVTTANGADITVQNFGTATAHPLTLNLNGTAYQFPFTLPGTGIIGPNTTVVDNIAVWNNTTGTLLANGPAFGTSSHTVPYLDGNNTYSGNALFANGKPWCDVRSQGAVGDGSTDDTAAFNACKAIVQAFPNSGTIYLPPSTGAYCIKTGPFVVNGYTSLVGAGSGQAISSCGSGNAPLVMGGSSGIEGYSLLQNIQVYGPGMDGGTGYGVTADALTVGEHCIGCVLLNVQAYGGRHALTWNSGEASAYQVTVANAYGSSNIYFVGSSSSVAAGFLYDVKPDQVQYPQGTIPSQGTVFGARATTHAYTAGTVVFATCQDGGSYYFQAMVGGTTSSSATLSNCANYGVNFTDGSVTWQLNFPTGFFHWQFDSYTAEVRVNRCDTGGGFAGVGMTNTVGGGAAPTSIYLTDCNGGNGYDSNFYAHDGNYVMLINFFTSSCITSGCSNIVFQNNFSGNVTISGGSNTLGVVGVTINSGTKYTITGVADWSSDTTAISLGNAVDYVAIHDNPVGGAPISNGSSGTNNDIHDNPGYNNQQVGASITVGSSPFTYTNGAQPQTVYMFGGTVSAVTTSALSPVTLCEASPCVAVLAPNEGIIVTYSGLPTMRSVTH